MSAQDVSKRFKQVVGDTKFWDRYYKLNPRQEFSVGPNMTLYADPKRQIQQYLDTIAVYDAAIELENAAKRFKQVTSDTDFWEQYYEQHPREKWTVGPHITVLRNPVARFEQYWTTIDIYDAEHEQKEEGKDYY